MPHVGGFIPRRPIRQLADLFSPFFISDGKTTQKGVNHDASLSTPCKSEKLEQKGLNTCMQRERQQNEFLPNKFDTETGSVFIKPYWRVEEGLYLCFFKVQNQGWFIGPKGLDSV